MNSTLHFFQKGAIGQIPDAAWEQWKSVQTTGYNKQCSCVRGKPKEEIDDSYRIIIRR